MAHKFIIAVRKDERSAKHPVGKLIFGNVEFHSDLVPSKDYTAYGGGMYDIDEEKKEVYLTKHSVDYGHPCFDNVDWKEIQVEEEFKDFKFLYTSDFPSYWGIENTTTDVTHLLKFCL